jgi:hypothetical protein
MRPDFIAGVLGKTKSCPFMCIALDAAECTDICNVFRRKCHSERFLCRCKLFIRASLSALQMRVCIDFFDEIRHILAPFTHAACAINFHFSLFPCKCQYEKA